MADYEALRLNVGLNTDTAIKDAQKLGADVQATLNKMDMGKLDSKTLTFIKNLTTASNRAQKLARDLQAFGETKIQTEAYKNLVAELKAAEKEADALIKKQDKLREKAGIGASDSDVTIQQKLSDQGRDFSASWNNIENKIQEANEDIKRVETQMQQLVASGKAFTLGKDTEKYKDMANNLNSANQATNILLEKYSEMTQADEQVSQGNEEVAESTEKATKATRAYGKTLGDVGRTILHSLRTALNRLVSAFRSLSKHLHSSSRGHNNFHISLKRSLNTILRYTLGIRSIFMLIKRLRSTVAEAFKVMAQEIPEVNNAISTLGTSFKQLKATFGTMFQPLLQALAPILNSIIQKVTSLMNAIARFFATLTGQDYVYEATVANYDYAESVKEAQKANEGALASFDKLNVIAKDNADKNTLGLTKDTVTYKKVKIDPEANWYTKLAKKIAEGWAKADLSEATNDIAETLANMLDGIKWEDIRGKTTKFAHTIATGINGITLPDEETGKSHLADSIGKTIAEALQTAIDTFDTFITDINWTNLGKFIATAIESLKDKLRDNDSWRKAGAAFGHLFQGLVKLGLELLVNDNVFAGLGTDLSDFINSIIAEGMKINPETNNTFIKDFGIALSTGFVNLLKEIEAFLDGSSDDLAESVNELFQGIDLFEIAKHMAIVFIKGLKTGLKLLLSAGLGALGITVDGDTAEFLAEALGIGLLGAKIAKLVGGITGSGGLLSAFSKKDRALGNQRKALGLETAAVGVLSGVLGALGLKALLGSGNVDTLTDSVKEGIPAAQGLKGAVASAATSLSELATAGAETAKEISDSTTDIQNNINSMTLNVPEIGTSALDTFQEKAFATVNSISEAFKQLQTQLSTFSFPKAPAPTTDTTTTTSTSGTPSRKPSPKSQYSIVDAPEIEPVKKYAGTPSSSEQAKMGVAGQTAYVRSTNAKILEETLLNYWGDDQTAFMADFYKYAQNVYGYNGGDDLATLLENSDQFQNALSHAIANTDYIIDNRVNSNLSFGDYLKEVLGLNKNPMESVKTGLSNLLKWLPMAGGAAGGFPIPYLAQGAVIPANQPFMAVLGDQKSGTNIEAPLSTIEKAVANVLSQMKIKAVFDVKGDPNGIFKVVQERAEIHYNRFGNNGLSGEG